MQARHRDCIVVGMQERSKNGSPRRSAFVPRLAFGCATLGMSVVPVIVASTACARSPAPVGILPAIPPDASPGEDSGFTGILPYIPDAGPDVDAAFTGILP